MIVINKLEFDNMFSYGVGNVVTLDKYPVLQLVGKNGAGKSSIPTILEELLYNKNSRGVKKADIKNRYVDDTHYSGKVYFTVGDDSYILSKTVKSSTTLVLTKNGEDISGHTPTQTYKLLETSILGLEFNTFSKLVYQSMNSSLDFLKATDSKRKEFLISLLSLDKYVTIHNQVKAATKEAKSQTDALSGEVKAIERSINQTPKDLTLKEEPIIPEVDDTLLEKSFDIKAKLREVDRVKSLIEQHGKLVEKLNNLPIIPAVSKPKTDLETLKSDKLKLTNQINEIVKSISDTKTNITKLKRGTGNCSSCGQTLPSASSNQEKISEQSLALQELESKLENLGSADKYDSLVLEHTRYNEYLREESDRASKQAQLQEQINSLGDVSAYSIEDISETEYHNVKKEYENQVAEQKKATALLDEVRKWNSRVDAKVEQLEKNKAELKEVTKKLVSATSRYNMLKVLQDAFGPKGLVQYKIESNIKVFEGLINDYLVMLSNGDFNIRFIIEDSKLKISVFQQGQEINMNSASSGEFNNINTATLLAVRKMMSSISKVSINLLMLDEVISVLDVQSRENLIDILIKENNLNSVVVSHGFEHPLAESLTISKENNISICK